MVNKGIAGTVSGGRISRTVHFVRGGPGAGEARRKHLTPQQGREDLSLGLSSRPFLSSGNRDLA